MDNFVKAFKPVLGCANSMWKWDTYIVCVEVAIVIGPSGIGIDEREYHERGAKDHWEVEMKHFDRHACYPAVYSEEGSSAYTSADNRCVCKRRIYQINFPAVSCLVIQEVR